MSIQRAGSAPAHPARLGLRGRVTVPDLVARKGTSEKITALTAYDFTMARLLDLAGVDLILVGDSLACIVQGEATTLPVTLHEMIYHCRCVSRGVEAALVVGDLPFLSYHVSVEEAVRSAGLLVKEGRVGAVKLEGAGATALEAVRRLVDSDVPVLGHVGLTPQSFHRMGGHRVQGRHHAHGDDRTPGSWERVLSDAVALEQAGVFGVVVEGVPSDLAAEITRSITVPTIGIGAGNSCDGQILVTHDLLGLSRGTPPRFVKCYADLGRAAIESVHQYVEEVRAGSFPDDSHSYRALPTEELKSNEARSS